LLTGYGGNFGLLAVEDDFGLLEVASCVLELLVLLCIKRRRGKRKEGGEGKERKPTFIDEHQTEVISGGVLLVDFTEGGG
jgi:hypothetical protein